MMFELPLEKVHKYIEESLDVNENPSTKNGNNKENSIENHKETKNIGSSKR